MVASLVLGFFMTVLNVYGVVSVLGEVLLPILACATQRVGTVKD